MSIHVGDKPVCEITYVDGTGVENTICEVAYGSMLVFGCEEPPTVESVTRDYKGGTYQFTAEDFTHNFSDPNGDSSLKVILDTLPSIGTVENLGVAVSAGFEFNLVDVGNITYRFPDGYTTQDGGYCDANGCYQMSDLKLVFRVSDNSTDQLYSQQADVLFNLLSGNTAPTVSDNTSVINQEKYTFKTGDFTLNFSDADGNGYGDVSVETLPAIGSINYLGSPVTEGFKVSLSNITGLSYLLSMDCTIESGVVYKYTKDVTQIVEEYKASGYKLTSHTGGVMTFQNDAGDILKVNGTQTSIGFTFKTSDDSQDKLFSNLANFGLTGEGDVHVQPPYTNTQPTVSDNELTVTREGVHTLNRELFLKDYSDVEGHDPYAIEAVTLPTNGTLLLNGVAVTASQVITFADIDAELLTFDPDTDTSVVNVAFEFNVIDNG